MDITEAMSSRSHVRKKIVPVMAPVQAPGDLLTRIVSEYRSGRHSAVMKAIESMAAVHPDQWPLSVSEAFGDALDLSAASFAKAKEWTMTGDQSKAWSSLTAWLKSGNPYFALKGVGGSGKSFLVQKLLELPNYNFHFAAPTNKAAQVLASFLNEDVRTVYSLLGLRMVADEDTMVLSTSFKVKDLGLNPIVVLDEAGMSQEMLVQKFEHLAELGWRFIFVGDPYQLNPVKERSSKVWKLCRESENRVMMKEVKRFDNELLALSIKIRAAIKARDFDVSPIEDDNSDGRGVFTMSNREAMALMKTKTLDDWRETKVAVWRNKTADKYTERIRKGLGFTEKFHSGEIILAAGPIIGPDDTILAYTDEEFVVKTATRDLMRLPEGNLDTTVLTLLDRDLKIIHCNDPERLQHILAARAADARKAIKSERKYKWEQFWKLKNSFHPVRYGYAMTTHRLQGSTYKHVFVDQSDILANHDELEAFRMLYVAASRPTTSLVAF